MSTIETLIDEEARTGCAFEDGLERDLVGKLAPAAYALMPHERMSSRYTFVPTTSVIEEMERAGFCIIKARQSKPRKSSPEFATLQSSLVSRPSHLGGLEAVSWTPPCESAHATWTLDVWFLLAFDGRTGTGRSVLVDLAGKQLVTVRDFSVRAG